MAPGVLRLASETVAAGRTSMSWLRKRRRSFLSLTCLYNVRFEESALIDSVSAVIASSILSDDSRTTFSKGTFQYKDTESELTFPAAFEFHSVNR